MSDVREYNIPSATVDDLIKQLQDLKEHGLPGNAIIHAWDAEMEDFYPLTMMTYENFKDKDPIIYLYTDEP